jgi:hypothetical protein
VEEWGRTEPYGASQMQAGERESTWKGEYIKIKRRADRNAKPPTTKSGTNHWIAQGTILLRMFILTRALDLPHSSHEPITLAEYSKWTLWLPIKVEQRAVNQFT